MGKKTKRPIKRSSGQPGGPRSVGPLDAHFGEKLRTRRLLMDPKMSQEELAQHLGITFQQIHKYEVGENRISAAMLVEIARHLKVDIQYFFAELPQSGRLIATTELTELALAAHGPRLIRSFLNLKNDTLRRAVVDLAEVLAR